MPLGEGKEQTNTVRGTVCQLNLGKKEPFLGMGLRSVQARTANSDPRYMNDIIQFTKGLHMITSLLSLL